MGYHLLVGKTKFMYPETKTNVKVIVCFQTYINYKIFGI